MLKTLHMLENYFLATVYQFVLQPAKDESVECLTAPLSFECCLLKKYLPGPGTVTHACNPNQLLWR
jgi:hypothetical protein